MARTAPLTHDDGDARALDGGRRPIEPGRLGVYAALGATVSAVPLPWLPGSLARRVRGALVHDIAMRHGLSLAQDARMALSDPSGSEKPPSFMEQALRFAGARLIVRALTRLGPLGAAWTLRDALRTFVLGHLFDRYLTSGRRERAVRIDVAEARRVRQAVEGALARALTIDAPPPAEPTPIDDQRDALTALIDGVLGLAAGVPSWLLLRLDTAFDELLDHARD